MEYSRNFCANVLARPHNDEGRSQHQQDARVPIVTGARQITEEYLAQRHKEHQGAAAFDSLISC
jgi:hypothetical protein